jgi:peptide/nickel transport system substrate-binding protein
MNREPLFLYLFRFFSGLAILCLMAMLYWSSLLQETELIQMRQTMQMMQRRLDDLKIQNIRKVSTAEETTQEIAHADLSLPNLLHDDPFYETTLPEILGPEFKPHGTFQHATIARPSTLHPFSNWADVNAWNGLCSLSVAQGLFGKYESMAPNMSLRMEERVNEAGKSEYWIFLRDNVFWHPLNETMFQGAVTLAPHFFERHQVTAEDFKFFFDVIMNPFVQEPGALALRNFFEDIEDVTVIDKLTLVVRWKTHDVDGEQKTFYRAKTLTGSLRPLASFVYKYFPDGTKIVEDDSDTNTYRTSSLWGQNFMEHWARNIIVSCGPWIFEQMTDRGIHFKRNPDYFAPLAALGEAIEVTFKESPNNIWQDFKNNKLDFHELQPDQISEYENFLKSDQYLTQKAQGYAINRLDYVARLYSYVAWNQAKPYFQSAKVRQALTMSIDRNRIIKQNLNGMAVPINGTFYRYSTAYDESIEPWPFDPQKARNLLAEEGWYDSDGDGIIDKEIDGKRVPFRFTLTYFVKNPTTKAIVEYIATALKEVGIEVKLLGVELADISNAFEEKSFDALTLAWGLSSPPEDPRQLWSSAGAKERGSSNAIGFANPEIDKIIEQLEFQSDRKKRIELYHRFDKIIHDEQPYTFLYTPKRILLYREYLKNVFIPADNQKLVPGADVTEPQEQVFYLERREV